MEKSGKKEIFLQELRRSSFYEDPELKANIDKILNPEDGRVDLDCLLARFRFVNEPYKLILANEVLLSKKFEGFAVLDITIKVISYKTLQKLLPEKFIISELKAIKKLSKCAALDFGFKLSDFEISLNAVEKFISTFHEMPTKVKLIINNDYISILKDLKGKITILQSCLGQKSNLLAEGLINLLRELQIETQSTTGIM